MVREKKAEREERQGKELKGNLLPGFAAAVKGPKKSTKELEVIKGTELSEGHKTVYSISKEKTLSVFILNFAFYASPLKDKLRVHDLNIRKD